MNADDTSDDLASDDVKSDGRDVKNRNEQREAEMKTEIRANRGVGRVSATLRAGVLAAFVAGLFAVVATPALADVQGTIALQGALYAAGGGPAADGDYQISFGLHAVEKDGAPLWGESQTIKVTKGQFWHVLGTVKPIPAGLFAVKGGAWLSMKVGNEPEMPRKRVHAVAYAARAAVAEGLSCTGCVSLSALKIDGDLNLGNNALTAGKITASGKITAGGVTAGDVVAKNVAASSFVGDGSKLTGIKIPSGTCNKKGEVVKGINADGTLICVVAMDPDALPPDGLDEVSNGLLSNQFVDVIPGGSNVAIPDNNPQGAKDDLLFPDIGVAQAVTVTVDLANSDVSKVTIKLTDPSGKTHVLYDKSATGKTLTWTWPDKDKQVSGDLSAWVGKNLKGKWTLEVIDTGYLDNKIDGAIKSWNITVKTLSNQKVQANGTLIATKGLKFNTANSHPVTCNAENAGYAYYNLNAKSLYICNGKEFDIAVKVALGTEAKPAPSCLAILNAGDSKGDGKYWLDPDGIGGSAIPTQAYCNMKDSGGGWTLALNLDTNDASMRAYSDTNFWLKDNAFGSVDNALTADYKNTQVFRDLAAKEILVRVHVEGANYSGGADWARYTVQAAYLSKSLKTMLNSGTNKTIAKIAQRQGAVAKNAYARNAGDVFIDHGLDIIVNSTGHGGTDADNTVRFGTDFKALCGHVSCNGHNVQGGYGGYHSRNGDYPLTYEAMPSFGYHPGPMGFGSNWVNNKGCGQSVWSNKCNPENATLQIDFAIYVR